VIRRVEDGGQFGQLWITADEAMRSWASVLSLTLPGHYVPLRA
jgi:hypothetical protein